VLPDSFRNFIFYILMLQSVESSYDYPLSGKEEEEGRRGRGNTRPHGTHVVSPPAFGAASRMWLTLSSPAWAAIMEEEEKKEKRHSLMGRYGSHRPCQPTIPLHMFQQEADSQNDRPDRRVWFEGRPGRRK
jgi:hypothetical protein